MVSISCSDVVPFEEESRPWKINARATASIETATSVIGCVERDLLRTICTAVESTKMVLELDRCSRSFSSCFLTFPGGALVCSPLDYERRKNESQQHGFLSKRQARSAALAVAA